MMPPHARPRSLQKLAIIAGESSGDQLGAGLIAALRERCEKPFSLVGVGGEAMEAEGLRSLFDYHSLSIVGASAVVARAPALLMRIRQTADAIIRARPDMLVIIDSPGFTHRVARRVRRHLPELPVVNYVCPTVWAWKQKRAARMTAYIDHVLSVLPFEPAIVTALGGPPITYVGHALTHEPGLLAARARQQAKEEGTAGTEASGKTCVLLPGSRSSELVRLLPPLAKTVEVLASRDPSMRFVLPAVRRHEERIRTAVETWSEKPEVVVGPDAKWRAFAQADAAIAASGTVLLELAITGVPTVSIYKLDAVAKLLTWRISGWTAALPNMIADYPVVPEYVNEMVRPGRLARWIERLCAPTTQRRSMLEGYDAIREAMETEQAPSTHAADVVLAVFADKARV